MESYSTDYNNYLIFNFLSSFYTIHNNHKSGGYNMFSKKIKSIDDIKKNNNENIVFRDNDNLQKGKIYNFPEILNYYLDNLEKFFSPKNDFSWNISSTGELLYRIPYGKQGSHPWIYSSIEIQKQLKEKEKILQILKDICEELEVRNKDSENIINFINSLDMKMGKRVKPEEISKDKKIEVLDNLEKLELFLGTTLELLKKSSKPTPRRASISEGIQQSTHFLDLTDEYTDPMWDLTNIYFIVNYYEKIYNLRECLQSCKDLFNDNELYGFFICDEKGIGKLEKYREVPNWLTKNGQKTEDIVEKIQDENFSSNNPMNGECLNNNKFIRSYKLSGKKYSNCSYCGYLCKDIGYEHYFNLLYNLTFEQLRINDKKRNPNGYTYICKHCNTIKSDKQYFISRNSWDILI